MNCPLPRYFLCHALIALLAAVAIWPFLGLRAGLAAGAAFYAGREYTQWESGLPFDWRGFLAPTVACGAALVLVEVLDR